MAASRSDPGPGSSDRARSRSRWRWGYGGAAWALLFAGLHVYWGAGGTAGLATSAGSDLAADRPLWFVLLGLWGVALVLAALAVVGVLLAATCPGGLPGRLVVALGWLAGAVLLARGVGVEVLLLTGGGGVARAVGPDQVHAGLVLWNPWFVVGGVVFVLAASQCGRDATKARARRR